MSIALGFWFVYSIIMTIAWLAAKGRRIQVTKELEQLKQLTQGCSCGHASSFHDDQGCHQEVSHKLMSRKNGSTFLEASKCPCRRYSGPPSLYGGMDLL